MARPEDFGANSGAAEQDQASKGAQAKFHDLVYRSPAGGGATKDEFCHAFDVDRTNGGFGVGRRGRAEEALGELYVELGREGKLDKGALKALKELGNDLSEGVERKHGRSHHHGKPGWAEVMPDRREDGGAARDEKIGGLQTMPDVRYRGGGGSDEKIGGLQIMPDVRKTGPEGGDEKINGLQIMPDKRSTGGGEKIGGGPEIMPDVRQYGGGGAEQKSAPIDGNGNPIPNTVLDGSPVSNGDGKGNGIGGTMGGAAYDVGPWGAVNSGGQIGDGSTPARVLANGYDGTATGVVTSGGSDGTASGGVPVIGSDGTASGGVPAIASDGTASGGVPAIGSDGTAAGGAGFDASRGVTVSGGDARSAWSGGAKYTTPFTITGGDASGSTTTGGTGSSDTGPITIAPDPNASNSSGGAAALPAG